MPLFSQSNDQTQNQNEQTNTNEMLTVHYVNENPLEGPIPENHEMIILGMGCFWGAEKIFWKIQGVFVTAVGYSHGQTPDPTYEQVCTGQTGHNEVIKVIFNCEQVSIYSILKSFWQNHNPTQGMRQGNDVGAQYRSGIYCSNKKQLDIAKESRSKYQHSLSENGWGPITTEIELMQSFHLAEDYHQQYLAKNPNGYCGLGGTGVLFKD